MMRMIDLELATSDLNKNLKLYYTTDSIFYPISEVISTSESFILKATRSNNPILLLDLLYQSDSESRPKKIIIRTINEESHLILGYRIDHDKLFLA
ncbi:hypothetical protein ACVPPR_05165 [Dellaglioa sp. L3N]